MKNRASILGLILGLFLLNSSKPYTSDNGSPKTRMDSLMSKKWERETNVKIFHKDTILLTTTFSDGKKITIRQVYYLTDDISKMGETYEEMVNNFDWSKVGKNSKGKFLVALAVLNKSGNRKYGSCDMCEILELTDNRLILRAASPTGERIAYPDLVYSAKPLD